MENELVMYEGSKIVSVSKRNNYEITSPMTGNTITLIRDQDFGVIPGTRKPSLLKSGAEKICAVYGLLQHFDIESKAESTDPNNPFFFYVVKCKLVKIANDGSEYVISEGYGSANTSEKSVGFQGAFNAANATLKKAVKRSLVAAAIAVGNASDLFTQDLEDSDFVEKGYKTIANTQDPNSRISSRQVQRLFAIANNIGLNAAKAKERLAILGYTKATELTQEKYDEVCELMGMDDDEFKEKTNGNQSK